MRKRMQSVCTLLLCVVLFASELFGINVNAADFDDVKESSEVQETEEKLEDEVDSETEEETENEADSETEEETEDEADNESEEETEDEADSEIEEETEEEIESEVDSETEEGTEDEADSESEEETEDDEEKVEQNEIITLSFSNLYGKGAYRLLNKGGEWVQADGSVEIELSEDSDVVMQIKADEGCFIVSETDEEYLTEMQIEFSWDNKDEFDGYVIEFESKINGTIELSSNSGFYGNEFTGLANIMEDINTEGTYVEWNYDETDLELLDDGSDSCTEGTFKVISNENKTIELGGKVYRDGVCLGVLTDTEYNILAINPNELLNKFAMCTSDNREINLMDTGECITGESLSFLAELNSEYIESTGHEVEKVFVTYASQKETMENGNSGKFSVNLTVEAASRTASIPQIIIVLDGGIDFAIEAQKSVKIDNNAPSIDVYLTDGENTITKKWLSKNNGFENVQLRVNVKDASEIKKCKITASDGGEKLTVNNIGDSYYVDIELIEKIVEYDISVEDIYGNCAETTYTVRVDNTMPSKKVKVSFSGDEKLTCDEAIEDGYFLGEGQGDVYCDSHITMDLEVEDDSENLETSSGISKVTVIALVTTTEGEKEQKYTFPCDEEGTVSFCINEDQPDPEMNYQIKQIYIEDYAGNRVELSEEDGCVDAVRYFVDNRSPIITYNYAGGIEDSQSEDVIYYSEATTGSVEILDLNLDKYQISVENVNDYEIAELRREAGSDTKAVYSFALNKDGEYQIYTEANLNSVSWHKEDTVNKNSKTMIVDTLAPIIEVKMFSESGTELTDYANQYYKENIKVSVSVKEKNVDSIEVKIVCDESVQTTYSQADFVQNQKEDEHALQCDLSQEGEYYLEVICKDKTGKEATFKSDSFTIDKTAPKVSITYDNNDAKNEFYFNDERTATITVEDIALDKESVDLKIENVNGNAPVLSAWTETVGEAGKIFTAQVSFTKDDKYEVSFACQDLAGNKSEECDGGYFVIDRTSPVVEITFDNYFSKNEIYYKEDRTAYITVTDLSFDKDAFTVSNAEVEDVVLVNSSGNWNESETYCTTEIECDKEGAYQFSIHAQDLAGNEAVAVSSEYFIIDKTVPEIEIKGITNESANQGDVAPVIAYKDKYLDDDNSIVSLSGYKNGVVTVNAVVSSGEGSRTVEYNGFTKTREMDDVYTLTVHIEDKAGNQSEEEYVFSINRFGSTFGVNKETAELIERYYTNKEQDIVITEVNVDQLQQEEIIISFNGEPRTLRKGRDYSIAAQGNSATWKSYTYTIYKENFEKEGQYIVSVFSKDAANNQSDNNVQDLEIAFAVDKTAPSIVVTGLEENGIYAQRELTFHMDIQDNMCLQDAHLLIDGKEVKIYDQEELDTVISYKLLENDEPVNITIEATDIVGNTTEKRFSNVLLSQDMKTIEEEEVAKSDGVDKDSLTADLNRFSAWIAVMVVIAVLLILSGVALSKKKEQEKS